MTDEKRCSNILRVRIDPELLDLVRMEAMRSGIDVSTYIRWCIQTGLYLEDLDLLIRSKRKESSVDELTSTWSN